MAIGTSTHYLKRVARPNLPGGGSSMCQIWGRGVSSSDGRFFGLSAGAYSARPATCRRFSVDRRPFAIATAPRTRPKDRQKGSVAVVSGAYATEQSCHRQNDARSCVVYSGCVLVWHCGYGIAEVFLAACPPQVHKWFRCFSKLIWADTAQRGMQHTLAAPWGRARRCDPGRCCPPCTRGQNNWWRNPPGPAPRRDGGGSR